MWRELCWWYVVYPAAPGGQETDIVFAVQVKKRRPAVQSAVLARQPGPGGPAADLPAHAKQAASEDGATRPGLTVPAPRPLTAQDDTGPIRSAFL